MRFPLRDPPKLAPVGCGGLVTFLCNLNWNLKGWLTSEENNSFIIQCLGHLIQVLPMFPPTLLSGGPAPFWFICKYSNQREIFFKMALFSDQRCFLLNAELMSHRLGY